MRQNAAQCLRVPGKILAAQGLRDAIADVAEIVKADASVNTGPGLKTVTMKKDNHANALDS